MFPAEIKGTKLQSGPIPTNFAMTGEIAATESPGARPQVITEIISTKFTMEPVTMIFPNGAVTTCNAVSKAIKIDDRVIQNILSLLFTMSYPLWPYCC